MTTAKTETAAKGKKLNVQVPGETAKTETAADLPSSEGAKPEVPVAGAGLADEVAAASPRSRAEYRNMRAADIDPTTLAAPVLTKDGWLCPSK